MAATPPSGNTTSPNDAGAAQPVAEPLKFTVAPNIVEDLGLNLYTSLPRVLAEFVANAYDADSPSADISIDYDKISDARESMRRTHKVEAKAAEQDGRAIEALGTQTLPSGLSIVVTDYGCGMSRDDLGRKFLVAGRRRRATDPTALTDKGRLIMGRKGLGKLAGFGVAKKVEVVSRKKGESHATRIILHYDELANKTKTEDVNIPDERLEDGGGFAESGTRVILSELLHDPTKSRHQTISAELADHFEMVRFSDFDIRINGTQIEPLARDFAFAWPKPGEVVVSELVEHKYETEDGIKVPIRYRMRFTKPEQALPGQRRGVRIYARGRLASAPSLLDANTNMHGFRMTDYLDGVVEADSLDSQKTDFIATDRQSLRWDSPLLAPLKDFLSDEIKEACKQYQKQRDGTMPGLVKNDPFTLETIKRFGLDGRDRTLAFRIATSLAGACEQGVTDPLYQNKYPEILRGVGQGNLLAAIAMLAEEEHPDFQQVAAKIVELTHKEYGAFVSIARGRVKAISALKKIVEDADFDKKKEEKRVQELLEKAPWMVDPTFGPTVSANEAFPTLYRRLSTELGIGAFAGVDAANSDDRPDLVFLMGNSGVGKLVIVELKAANVPLESAHLDQLLDYMSTAEDWLRVNAPNNGFVVQGHLMGMMNIKSRARGQVALRQRMKAAGPDSSWKVRSFIEVLTDTEHAHREMLEAHAAEEKAFDVEDEEVTA